MRMMTMGCMCMMACLLVITRFVVVRCFVMVAGRPFVMIRCVPMMFRALMFRHTSALSNVGEEGTYCQHAGSTTMLAYLPLLRSISQLLLTSEILYC
jgi:hypothetical protein